MSLGRSAMMVVPIEVVVTCGGGYCRDGNMKKSFIVSDLLLHCLERPMEEIFFPLSHCLKILKVCALDH